MSTQRVTRTDWHSMPRTDVGRSVTNHHISDHSASEIANWQSVEKASRGKKVFVLCHMGWCGPCREFKPIWDELEKEYKDNRTVLVTSLQLDEALKRRDGTARKANDTLPASVRAMIKGYPTILYGEDVDSLQEYTGERRLEIIKEFIEQYI